MEDHQTERVGLIMKLYWKILISAIVAILFTSFKTSAQTSGDMSVKVNNPAGTAVSPAPQPANGNGNGNGNGGIGDISASFESLSARIDDAMKRQEKLEQQMVDQINLMNNIIKDLAGSEKNLKGFSSLGRIEQMELKADLYSIERQSRRRIEGEFAKLTSMVETWEACKAEIKENRRILALKKQINDLKNSIENNSTSIAKSNDIKDIEYYEVKQAMPLTEISAKPEVYGNPDMWQNIYNANKEKIKDPSKPIPAGTKLVIPNVSVKPDFTGI